MDKAENKMGKRNNNLNEILRLHIKQLKMTEDEDMNGNKSTNIAATISEKEYQLSRIKVEESELIRVLKVLNPDRNTKLDGSEFMFVKDLVVLKVGNSNSYESFKDTQGIFTLKVIRENSDDTIEVIEEIQYKRLVCSSGHNRSKKTMFVNVEVWDKADEIFRCGISRDDMFIPSKYNAYYGLIATDTKPVSTPNIVVVDDYKTKIRGKYDIVSGSIKDSQYTVENNKETELEVLPFDGSGLVSVQRAKKWSKELGLDYIPASFQFRCIPGIKGNLFTFDIEEFSRQNEHKTKIHDHWGKEWDLKNDKIDCIMTLSQFKFHSLYNSFEDWKSNFDIKSYGYKRTFNISEQADKFDGLKDNALMCYQPLQTLQLSDNEIESLCKRTVTNIKKMHTDPKTFLKYKNIKEYDENGELLNSWNYIQPFYKAMYFNNDLFYDDYVQGRVKRDLKTAVRKAYVGKLLVDGNYQTLSPDIYGLAQYAFGIKVTGLLEANGIYSNYWNNQYTKVYDDDYKPWYIKGVSEVDLLRNPHIANEHCPVNVVFDDDMIKWYKYQTVNIITSVHDTNAMKLNSADFDGDHVLTVNNPIILKAAKRNVGNTIEFIQYDETVQAKKCKISDIQSLITTDLVGFKNNIGDVINRISILWSLQKTDTIKDYIKIMSVIGSLTIDFVKTGQKAQIPNNIEQLIKKFRKPIFMMYRKESDVSKERMIKREISRYKNNMNIKSSERYSTVNCTMNNICKHLKKEFSDINIDDEDKKDKFDWIIMLNNKVNPYNKTYVALRNKFFELQDEFIKICRRYSKVSEDDKKDFSQRQYQRFYSYCKVELQSTYVRYNNENCINNKILDYLIYMLYCDSDIMKKFGEESKSIIWNTFPDQMINRASGDFKVSKVDKSKLNERRARSLKHVEEMKKNNRVVSLSKYDQLEAVSFTKADRKQLNKLINTKVKHYKEARALMFVFIIFSRKINSNSEKIQPIEIKLNCKNEINYSRLCKLSGIDIRNYDKVREILEELNLINVNIKNPLKPKYIVNFEEHGGEDCCVIKSMNNCSKAILNDYRYIEKMA